MAVTCGCDARQGYTLTVEGLDSFEHSLTEATVERESDHYSSHLPGHRRFESVDTRQAWRSDLRGGRRRAKSNRSFQGFGLAQ